MTEHKLNVFISYAREDKKKIHELSRWLEAGGWITVWQDVEILPGQEWEIEIEKAARSSDVVLVCLSHLSVKKVGFVQKEIRFILELADEKPEGMIFAIPVRLEECEVPNSLRRWEWVDVFNKHGYGRLMRSLIARATSSGVSISRESENQPRQKNEKDIKTKRRLGWAMGGLVLSVIVLAFILLLAGFPASLAAPTSTVPAATTPPSLAVTEPLVPAGTATSTPLSVTPTIAPGTTRASPKDGMILLYVPAASFRMGTNSGGEDQQPEHEVALDGFWFDQTEVTNQMFGLFVQTTGYQTEAEKTGCSNLLIRDALACVEGAAWNHPFGRGSSIFKSQDNPVVHVTWNDASAYCAWRGDGYRLPTEAEWELAARGTDGRVFPWGNDSPTADLLNYNNDFGFPVRVGKYPNGASPYSALDMAGNVAEWVSDWYLETYYSISPRVNPPGPDFGQSRVTRGGSWNFNEINIRATYRRGYPPGLPSNLVGFRCAQTILP
jgi:serine/threonine-protein kinase